MNTLIIRRQDRSEVVYVVAFNDMAPQCFSARKTRPANLALPQDLTPPSLDTLQGLLLHFDIPSRHRLRRRWDLTA
eukprot:3547963-Pyramimonas_sp.AAC.2